MTIGEAKKLKLIPWRIEHLNRGLVSWEYYKDSKKISEVSHYVVGLGKNKSDFVDKYNEYFHNELYRIKLLCSATGQDPLVFFNSLK